MPASRAYGLLFLVSAFCSAQGLAQVRPDAGALQEQIEREFRPAPQPPVIKPLEKPTAPVAAPKEAVQVVVRGFRFQGNTLISDQALALLLESEIGKAYTLEGLRGLTNKIAAFYRESGWIARVLLPPQDLTDGAVTFQIIESVLGEVSLEGSAPSRFPLEQIRARLLAQQRIGEPLSTRKMDRSVLVADDLPGVRVEGSYVPGLREGETRYVYRAVDEHWVSGDAKADNHGSRSTGSDRLAATFVVSSPLGIGDQWQVNAARSEGSEYKKLAASLPVGVNGWRAGLNGSWLRYRVITPELSQLALKGSSETKGVELSYPIVRSARENLVFTFSAEKKQFFNESSFGTLSDYATSGAQVALSWNRIDRLWRGGSSFGQFSAASVRLGDIAIGPQADLDRHVSKFRYGLGRQQTLSPDLRLMINFSGQWTDSVLDSSEKFSLGGASGVRAYPSGEASGARANLLNTEVRWRLSQQWESAAFYDWGKIKNLDLLPSYTLEGAGVSLNFMALNGAFLSAVWSQRIGSNPNAGVEGNDQDGTLRKNRFWLSAGWKF